MKKIIVLLVTVLFLAGCKKEVETQDSEIDSTTIQQNIETKVDSIAIKRNDSIQLAKKDSVAAVKKAELEKSKKSKKYAVYKGDAFSYWPIKTSDSLRKLFLQYVYKRAAIYHSGAKPN